MNLMRKLAYYMGERLMKLGQVIECKAIARCTENKFMSGLWKVIMMVGRTISVIGTEMILFFVRKIGSNRNLKYPFSGVREHKDFLKSVGIFEGMFEIPALYIKDMKIKIEQQMINEIRKLNLTEDQLREMALMAKNDSNPELVCVIEEEIERLQNIQQYMPSIARGGCEVQTGCFRRADCSEDNS